MRELHIDWAALHSAFQMNMPEVRCFLSKEDGRVLKVAPSDPQLADVRRQAERFVPIEAVPSRIQYQWLDEFIAGVEDTAVRARMEAAINGKGAFRRFKDILLTLPEERRRWFEFRDQAMRQRLEDWVRENDIEPLNEPPWVNGEYTASAPQDNSPHDIEALRDLLIAWVDERGPDGMTPLALEDLAGTIAARFRIKPV